MSECLNSDRLNNDFQFIEVGCKDPKKKLLRQRKREFVEIHDLLKPQQAVDQAHRCLGCGNPYCEWRRPVYNFTPDWLKLVSEGSILAAVELPRQTNTLPEVCGRVCPQDCLCEGACTLNNGFGAMTIGSVEKYITGMAFAMGRCPDLSKVKPTGRRATVIGAGPAGLGCTGALVHNGVISVVFDRNPGIDGLLTSDIPEFKLEKYVLSRHRKVFTGMDIKFRLNTEIGKDVAMEQLFDEYDAVFVGVGIYICMKGGFPGEDLPGVHDALDFLIANVNRNLGLGKSAKDSVDMKGKRVVVLGGGDTAMDCNRTSTRQGAKSMTRAYRRDEESMSGSCKEVKDAKKEGVKFLFNRQPVTTVGEDRVEGAKVAEICLGEPGARGRRSPEPIPGSEEVISAEAALTVLGSRPSPMPWFERFEIATDNQDCVVTPAQAQFEHQTSNPKILADGDMVCGFDLAATAIFEGHIATEGILDYLGV